MSRAAEPAGQATYDILKRYTVLQFTGQADFWHPTGMSWYAWGRDHAVSAESVFMVT